MLFLTTKNTDAGNEEVRMSWSDPDDVGHDGYSSDCLWIMQQVQTVFGITVYLQVDYASDPVMMLKPQKEVIRRSFHYGIWLQHRRSAHQTQLHVMLHQLQVLVCLHTSFCRKISWFYRAERKLHYELSRLFYAQQSLWCGSSECNNY